MSAKIEREEALTEVAAEPNPRRWLILAVVGTAFFMTILDVAIVNVAIPSIEIEIRNERPVPDEHVFHVAVPAAQWWDDIVFT